MKARSFAFALALSLVAAATWAADGAVRRGSGGGGGGGGNDKQAVGARHHGGGSGGGSYNGGGGGSNRGGSRPVSGAEARHPRAGTGSGYYRKGGYYRYPYYGSYYRGYYPYYGYGYYPYYGGYWDGYWGWGASLGWGIGYGWGSPYYGSGGYATYSSPGYYRSTGYGVGSLRLLVKPEQTKVYVDGYYTGDVDEFDGLLQRLNLSAGRHEIAFKLEGHRDYRVKVYVAVDRTLKIKHAMEKGSGPEVYEDLTEGHGEDPEPAQRAEGERWDPRDERESREPVSEERPFARDLGSVRFDVTPADASVYVDGEFQGSARRLGELDLRAGRHRVEVVRPGFETVERDVEIEPGRVARIAIDLNRR